MKYLITEEQLKSLGNRQMMNLVGRVIHSVYPEFNKKDVKIRRNGENEIYHADGIFFARYYSSQTLQLNYPIYDLLESLLGENIDNHIVDWFNNEFDKHAEEVFF
jgi:hypothetical protein